MSPRAVVRGGVLTFTAVEPADEGEYTCKALNTHGEHTARVSLIVQSRCLSRSPVVRTSPPTHTVGTIQFKMYDKKKERGCCVFYTLCKECREVFLFISVTSSSGGKCSSRR